MKTPDKAMTYLMEHGYTPEDSPLTLHTIAFILFQIAAASNSATDSDGIKAVAMLLEEIDVHGITTTLADRVTVRIENKIKDVAQALIAAKENELEYTKAAGKHQQKALMAVRNEVGLAVKEVIQGREDLEAAQNGLENLMGEAAEFFKISLDKIAEQIETITSSEVHNMPPPTRTTSNPPNFPPQTTTFSYAQITGQHLPSTHTTNITRNNDKRCQFTIQPANRNNNMGIDTLNELEIVAKLKLAFESMTVGKDSAPTDLRFTSVRRMKKGGILFDTNTNEAADWLREEATQRDFTKHFSATAVVQGYQFRVLAEFVPITFDAGSTLAAATIEEANYLPAGSVVEVGWVKRADRRSATQQVAHLKIVFAKIEQANDAIEKGLSIQGKGVNVRQMIVEPQRCAKCQLYGHDNNRGAPHSAKNCAWTHDVCGLCDGMHQTSDCSASMPDQARCANCKVSGRECRGHSVHSRTCPTFLEMKGQYNNKHRSQQYQFFVTEDAKTWETKASEYTQPGPSPPSQEGLYYPTPPPNQLQRQEYARPPPGPQGPPRQRPPIHVRGTGSGARGIQLSATNRVPLGQGNLNRFLAVQNTSSMDDEIDKEIEATSGLPVMSSRANETAQETVSTFPENTLSWGDNIPTNIQTGNTSPVSISTPITTRPSNTSPMQHYNSSPICFPSSSPAPNKPVSK